MRHRSGLACLLFILVAACGDDGGGSGVDGGGSGQDMYVPPMANCTPLDLTSAAAIPITNQQVTPNAQGGTIVAGTYKLTSVKLYAQGISVSGTAKARVEFVTGDAASGAARVALIIDAMALGMPVEQDVNGAGLYTIAGSALNLAEGCGGMNPLSGLTYTAAASSMTIWTSYMVTDPIALTIPIELVFDTE
ncbi:MAG: hypothetical protein AB7T06_35530 [Kofleriaceae bacterium]